MNYNLAMELKSKGVISEEEYKEFSKLFEDIKVTPGSVDVKQDNKRRIKDGEIIRNNRKMKIEPIKIQGGTITITENGFKYESDDYENGIPKFMFERNFEEILVKHVPDDEKVEEYYSSTIVGNIQAVVINEPDGICITNFKVQPKYFLDSFNNSVYGWETNIIDAYYDGSSQYEFYRVFGEGVTPSIEKFESIGIVPDLSKKEDKDIKKEDLLWDTKKLLYKVINNSGFDYINEKKQELSIKKSTEFNSPEM